MFLPPSVLFKSSTKATAEPKRQDWGCHIFITQRRLLPVARHRWSIVDSSPLKAMVKNQSLKSLQTPSLSISFHRFKWQINQYNTYYAAPLTIGVTFNASFVSKNFGVSFFMNWRHTSINVKYLSLELSSLIFFTWINCVLCVTVHWCNSILIFNSWFTSLLIVAYFIIFFEEFINTNRPFWVSAVLTPWAITEHLHFAEELYFWQKSIYQLNRWVINITLRNF